MKTIEQDVARPCPDLERAVAAWVERGHLALLERWFARALDDEGVPRRLAVPDWLIVLERLGEARRRRPAEWPERFDACVEGLLRAILRFSRPDGTPAFRRSEPALDTGVLLREWVRRLADPGLETVVNWWFPARRRTHPHAPPPLPAWSSGDRPLAVLRANWTAGGDFLALDHRPPGTSCAFELFGLGRTWLGPFWALGRPDAVASPARPTCWVTSASADLAEWAFRTGETRVVRTAALLRGRQLALVAEQVEGPGPLAVMRVGLPDGVTAEPTAGTRALSLLSPRGRARARVFPLALPWRPEWTERGSLAVATDAITLTQPHEARRSWRPLVVSWAPERNRHAAQWRTLTVSEKSKPCAPGTAFAARLSWGRDETLVVYRSLARPALRAFLGHQTRARFLIGLFTSEGKVEPILKVDE